MANFKAFVPSPIIPAVGKGLLLLSLVTPALAQVPHPYAYGGLSLNSGGYSPAAGTIGAGLSIDTSHIVAITEVWADDARKQDSGTGQLGVSLSIDDFGTGYSSL